VIDLLVAAAVAALPFQELPAQKPEPGRCVLFLWTRAEPPLRIAMIDEKARVLRVRIGGRQRDLPQSASGHYADADFAVTLDLDMGERQGLAGAVVEQGALTLDRPGADTMVVSVGGLRACQ
jgi:hypothetical protein